MNIHENSDSIQGELLDFKDTLRENLLQFTLRAFNVLPKIKNPQILDIGCGSGVPTIELARLSRGYVTGVDIDQIQLNRLLQKVHDLGLSSRIKVINRSMLDLDFTEENFDVIWAEGAIAVIGFEKGIKIWRHLLRPGGFLVVHDDFINLAEKLQDIACNGYVLIDHFVMNESIWWNEYYSLLEKKLEEMRQKHTDDQKLKEILDYDQREVDGFSEHHELYRSVFLIMQKGNSVSIHTC